MKNFISKFFRGKAEQKQIRPLVFAHRGARKLAPENTIAAFKKAVKLGFDGIEMDIVLSKDKVPFVFHGDDLSPYTRSTGLIHTIPASDVAKIDAGSLFAEKWSGEKIPTLEETLNYLESTDVMLNLELKSQVRRHKGIETIVGMMLENYNLKDRVIISSFSPLILRRFAKKFPQYETALLVGPHPFFFLRTLLSANMLKVKAINPIFQYTTDALVRFAYAQGWKVYVWNVTTQQEYKRAVEMGVEGIITDEPELLKVKL